jgi:hypothetical protein
MLDNRLEIKDVELSMPEVFKAQQVPALVGVDAPALESGGEYQFLSVSSLVCRRRTLDLLSQLLEAFYKLLGRERWPVNRRYNNWLRRVFGQRVSVVNHENRLHDDLQKPQSSSHQPLPP